MIEIMNSVALFIGWFAIGIGCVFLLIWPAYVLANIVSQFIMWRLVYHKARHQCKPEVSKTLGALREAWDNKFHRLAGYKTTTTISGDWGWAKYYHPFKWKIRVRESEQ